MKKLQLILYTLLALPLILSALEDFSGALWGDIDHDGRVEKFQWARFATIEEGDCYFLTVIDDDGTVLWRGPKTVNVSSPYIFCALDEGFSLPELLADIDGDGYLELLSPRPQSDVSPTYYRRIRWKGGQFEILPEAVLFADSSSPDRFSWRTNVGDRGLWISRLYPDLTEKGWVKADLLEYQGGGRARIGKAYIRFEPGGARVVQWIERLAESGGDQLPTAPEVVPEGAVTEREITAPNLYTARLSRRDHFNSRGVALRSAKAILRQDRANYYRGVGDPEDQADPFFRTFADRQRMERFRIEPVDIGRRQLFQTILRDTPLIEVRVENNTLFIRLLP